MKPFGSVWLPRTPTDFDLLVKKVCKRYAFTDETHAAAVISVAIRHLPNEQGYTRISYLGDYVVKNLANYVSNLKSERIKHEAQIRELVYMLEQNPNNNQALDELRKAADQGSEPAKVQLKRLEDLWSGPKHLTVVPNAPEADTNKPVQDKGIQDAPADLGA
jgi:hypothetical protein